MREASASAYCEGVLAGDRRWVAKAITLLESTRPDHRELGQQVLERLVPHAGRSLRIGITGPPGVGKSSFIEALGLLLVEQGRRVAVLAVDPSSPVSGGSILGDKTRMERLARDPRAFIRPSPSGGTLGGVAHRTREALIVCEAAGHDVSIVETVGVGQSEVEVHGMVDLFTVLLQPGAGDELQGLKRGVIELADVLVVNKADGALKEQAERTRADYAAALHLLRPAQDGWTPRVLAASARTGDGLAAFWETVLEQREAMTRSGRFAARRREQTRAWLWRLLEDGLADAFRTDPEVAARLATLEKDVERGEQSAPNAARQLLELFLRR
jgi:LAO/AO transport system kinase